MHGHNDRRNHPIYAPSSGDHSPFFLGKSHPLDAPLQDSHSVEIEALEDHLRELFQHFTKLAEEVISHFDRKKYHKLKLNFPEKEEFNKHIKAAPAAIQAIASFELASFSYDDFCNLSEQFGPYQRYRHLLSIQVDLLRAYFQLESAQSRSIKASIAGKKSHEQSERIKTEALRLLDELCPAHGWRSMTQAAKALDERLRPIVAEQGGRLNPRCLEDRLLEWLRDTEDILNPKYHELKQKRKR